MKNPLSAIVQTEQLLPYEGRDQSKKLLSELLRPQQLGDLTLPQGDIDRLQRMINTGRLMNMLFYGPPGLGKTSAAHVLMKSGDFSKMVINGSSETGVEFVRAKIEKYASSQSAFGKSKVCFIDEAHYLSKNAQQALRCIIEKFSNNCRFLFAVNNVARIVPAIRSRLKEICFDIAPADRVEIQNRLIERFKAKLGELGIECNNTRLAEIVGIYYPDLRAIANEIEYEFA